MRCPIIVGRRPEQAALDGLVVEASFGRGGSLAIVGEAGIGKTRLVEYAIGRAETSGLTPMVGRASPRPAPLRPIAEMLLDGTRDVPPPVDAPALAPYLAVVGALIPHWLPAGVTASSEHPLVLAESVLRSVVHLAGDRGVLVVLEDLHWSDAATDEVVAFLAGRLAGTPVAMLLTARDDERSGSVIPDVPRLQLGPLSAVEIEEMVEACLGRGAGAVDDVDRVAEQSAGIPLLIEDVLGTSVDGPARFPNIVASRIRTLSPEDRGVLDAAAVLGPIVNPALVASTLDRPPAPVLAACERAAAAGLLRDDASGFAFRHALTREAVLDGLAPARAAALATAAAEALLRERSNSTTLVEAGELLIAGRQPERAAGVLIAAAGAARDEGHLGAAEAALRRAAPLLPDDPGLETAVQLQLADVLLQLGNAAEADAASGAALTRAEGRDHRSEAAAHLALARAAALQGRWKPADEHVRAARRAVRGDPLVIAEAAVLDARFALAAGRGRAEAGHLAAGAAALAHEAGSVDLACEARLIGGMAARTTDLDASIAELERALDLAEADHLGRLRLEILNELGASELLRDASADRLERALAECERAGAVGLAVSVRVNLSAVYLMTARFPEVAATAEQVEVTATLLGLDPLLAVSHLHRGQAAGLSGDRATMDRHLGLAESLAPDDRDLHAAAWAVGRALNAILDEDRDAARRAFATAGEVAPDIHASFLNPFEGPALLLRAVEGDVTVDGARDARCRVVRGARYHELWTGAANAVALGAAGDGERAAADLDDALAAGAPYPIFSAITRRLVAEAQARDRWGDPVAVLRPAEAIFTGRGLTRCAAACRGLLKEAGAAAPRRRGGDVELPPALARAGVTAREAEVLDLLIDRLTNKQIGERLYCSPRTVEKHVASLCVKLDADRARLAEIGRLVR